MGFKLHWTVHERALSGHQMNWSVRKHWAVPKRPSLPRPEPTTDRLKAARLPPSAYSEVYQSAFPIYCPPRSAHMWCTGVVRWHSRCGEQRNCNCALCGQGAGCATVLVVPRHPLTCWLTIGKVYQSAFPIYCAPNTAAVWENGTPSQRIDFEVLPSNRMRWH